ncbi:L-asparaginase [Paratrimastix pyriformis]|uniref:asparaginase n=1 Tax=Paratrimastix pyriformis TaxID=342808 RepID=A0ABQ8UUV0_9EUKA|nr:L-asparaginase [Paratrimastix pyriformis]
MKTQLLVVLGLLFGLAAAVERMGAPKVLTPNYVNKKLYIMYTGGTIGMAKTDQGYAPKPGFLQGLMNKSPAFNNQPLPKYVISEYSPLLDSSNMVPTDWLNVAKDIYDHYDEYDAFVVIHGTDTLAYTASALSFLLGNLNKTVIVTGSQIPMVEPYSDATNNLLGAIMAAAMYPHLPEVTVYFKGSLLRGNRVQKLSSWDFAAFDSGAFPPLGTWGGSLEIFSDHLLSAPTQPLQLYEKVSPNVITILLYPGITGDLVRRLIFPPKGDARVEAVLLLAFGMGNGPDANQEFMDVLAEATQHGIIVVDSTQCFRGIVDLTHYATGSALAKVGCIGGMDMTPDAAFTKLAWLLARTDLGQGDERLNKVKSLMQVNLRGEMMGPLVPNM